MRNSSAALLTALHLISFEIPYIKHHGLLYGSVSVITPTSLLPLPLFTRHAFLYPHSPFDGSQCRRRTYSRKFYLLVSQHAIYTLYRNVNKLVAPKDASASATNPTSAVALLLPRNVRFPPALRVHRYVNKSPMSFTV